MKKVYRLKRPPKKFHAADYRCTHRIASSAISGICTKWPFLGFDWGRIFASFAVTLLSAMALHPCAGGLNINPCVMCRYVKPLSSEDSHKVVSSFFWFNNKFCRQWLRPTKFNWATCWDALDGTCLSMCILVVVLGVACSCDCQPVFFLPDEDQGRMFALLSLPQGAVEERHLLVNG